MESTLLCGKKNEKCEHEEGEKIEWERERERLWKKEKEREKIWQGRGCETVQHQTATGT